jgi:hypothetical protein
MSLLAVFFVTTAWAADRTGVPTRQIPPSVLNEVRLLENRFELALALDCAPDKCFSKGCTYVAHAVAESAARRIDAGLGEQPTGRRSGAAGVPHRKRAVRSRTRSPCRRRTHRHSSDGLQ